MLQTLLHRELAPFQIVAALDGSAALELLGDLEEPLRCIIAPCQDHILDTLAQIGGNLLVDAELARVDDTHGHSRADRVVQEHRVHGLPHRIVAAERERRVAHAPAHMHRRHQLLDLRRCLDEIQAVAIVFLYAGGHRKNVRVENNVLGREIELFRQKLVGALADRYFALYRVRLALFVERHHHDRRTVTHT